MGRMLRLVGVVVALTLALGIGAAKAAAVVIPFWIGFGHAPFPWWIVWPSAIFVAFGLVYIAITVKR